MGSTSTITLNNHSLVRWLDWWLKQWVCEHNYCLFHSYTWINGLYSLFQPKFLYKAYKLKTNKLKFNSLSFIRQDLKINIKDFQSRLHKKFTMQIMYSFEEVSTYFITSFDICRFTFVLPKISEPSLLYFSNNWTCLIFSAYLVVTFGI